MNATNSNGHGREDAEGGDPATNVAAPRLREPALDQMRTGADVSTVTPQPAQSPDPVLTGAYDTLKWILSDPLRALYGLAYLVVCLAAFVLATWLIGPFLGTIFGTSGLVIGATRWHRATGRPGILTSSPSETPGEPAKYGPLIWV